jgi:CO dehydrogenase/acetyl-CoA synthase epsilon subunit
MEIIMSWWIYLEDENGNSLETDKIIQEGGIQVVGGTNKTTLNVTYNYGKHFCFKQLNRMPPNKAIPVLKEKIKTLNDDVSEDYWEPTEGNVKKTLNILLGFAEYAVKQNISSIFRVS